MAIQFLQHGGQPRVEGHCQNLPGYLVGRHRFLDMLQNCVLELQLRSGGWLEAQRVAKPDQAKKASRIVIVNVGIRRPQFPVQEIRLAVGRVNQ